ncbi:type VI secretion system ImpA domain-containing protein [Brenneria alni]|uniref:Type VI secretion system ImpA domain-containing protein n=1 Tax=Brenneria alni TaxID=71656 RepID=A0A421DM29_9GAMM|nr:type VI secretion system protein TssA [Brenneria alni]RLM21874.1 type VI secretion system ImpA domain-containing protein [Brenneria alni]
MENSHPWCRRLLADLPDEATRGAVPADDPQWEYVETELVKLGSLAHSQVNLNDVAERCLTLLENKTKDMRVLAQMLRCLQHPARPAPFATALMLLESWVAAYWELAWPASAQQKRRLMNQVVKRFESAFPRLGERASGAELAQLLQLTEGLAQCWQSVAPDNGELLDGLFSELRRAQRQQQEKTQVNETRQAPQKTRADTRSAAAVGECDTVEIDGSNERAWRQTLLKVAELLVEQQPEAAVGYRLRRHAVWSGISSPPIAGKGNKTQLAPVPADMVNDYQAALPQADPALWRRVEQSLTLAPYWFDGHRLSAQAAIRLGHPALAVAIAEELSAFLQRFPVLRDLAFSDGTPFYPADCDEWLRSAQPAASPPTGQTDPAGEVKACRAEKGLDAALALLDERMQQQKEPRGRFYTQLALADFLAAEGMKTLAGQHYHGLWQEAQRLGLAQWEPGLVSRLDRHAASWSKQDIRS